MNKKQNINLEKGLASKIYGFAYEKPMSGYALAKKIGTQSHHVLSKIKKMHKAGYIDKIEKKKWRHPKWQSNVNPLITKICNIKEKECIYFSELDKKIFHDKFDSSLFRSFASGDYKHELKTEGNENSIDSILCTFEIFLMTISQLDFYKGRCEKVIDEKSYENEISKTIQSHIDLYKKYNFKYYADSIKKEEINSFLNKFFNKYDMKIDKKKAKELILEFQNTTFLPHKDSEEYKKMMKQFKDLFSNPEKLFNYVHFIFTTPVSKHIIENYPGISSWGRKFIEISNELKYILEFRIMNYI